MKKIITIIFLLIISVFSYSENFEEKTFEINNNFFNAVTLPYENSEIINENQYIFLYNLLGLEDKIEYRIFKMALKGYYKISEKKNNYLTIIDFSKSSNEKRFLTIDMNMNKLVYYTYVAHGKNSGVEYAVSFSNKLNSYKSSLGFYLTGKTYNGRYGYSLKLFGLEEGYNSNAFKRGVVIHGATTSEPEYIKKSGFLGRTEGCPAVPKSLNKEIVNTIRGGSVVFIYGNDDKYLRDSKYIK